MIYSYVVQRGNLHEIDEEMGSSITAEEITKSIRKFKDNKAAGPDEVHSDLLKLIEDDHLDTIVDVFNHIYETGVLQIVTLIYTLLSL